MPRKKESNAETCPVARTLDVVGDRWSMLIVRDAFDGAARFSDFQRRLGMARNILADRLRTLVEHGILSLQPATDGSVYQEYVLTKKGGDLFTVIVALRQWGERHLFEDDEPRSALLDKASGTPLAVMVPTTTDGKAVSAKETAVQRPLQ
ncbi:winged helix-turn-helix transcriptional regulator [Pseudoduganella plicata]|uniref:Transcriptional regulator n=1 Tax=Pseudoduganella plicata TaxID=321984 RepID=A0A4P7BC45_9BURK|nr:helix-turn-helix domain-containing protein [Pseudoduganella plicata]QBQ36074.1 transcriptional regulator [Pseudoduganella plicata]GGY78299.1 transcriptional regulator [Pseudoduganella plicata]